MVYHLILRFVAAPGNGLIFEIKSGMYEGEKF